MIVMKAYTYIILTDEQARVVNFWYKRRVILVLETDHDIIVMKNHSPTQRAH